MTENTKEYFVASIAHTHKPHLYITFWRHDDKGYAWPLPWSGRYSEARVLEDLVYYNDGIHTVAVPTDVVEKLAVPPAKGQVDNDAGPVVPNNAENWKTILAATIRPPLNKVKLYPGW